MSTESKNEKNSNDYFVDPEQDEGIRFFQGVFIWGPIGIASWMGLWFFALMIWGDK